jgi:hypothetical protein
MNRGPTVQVTETWERAMASRRVLDVRPDSAISIKRDVHVLDIDAEPAAFADAFHRTMRAPGVRFGTLQVLRPRARTGQPFELGDRFQGRFNLVRLLEARGWTVRPWSHRLLDRIADATASDYGLLDLLELDGAPVEGVPTWRFRYRYLEGSPIAGSSTFTVQPGPHGCRLTQVFVYQELRPDIATFFSIYGLKIHNQVVYDQTRLSADALGATIVRSDIPDAYVSRRD